MKKIIDKVVEYSRTVYSYVDNYSNVVFNALRACGTKYLRFISNNPKTTTLIWLGSLYITWRLS